jgi:hypothetical protein
MQVVAAFYWFERWSQFLSHRGGIVLADRETATLFGTALGERSYDEVAVDWQGSLNQVHIVPSVLWIGDEMKHRSVVPDIELAKCVELRDVGYDPFDMRRSFTKSSLGCLDGGLRYIEYGDMLEAGVEQSVDEKRLASADVKHAAASPASCLKDQIE